MYRLTFLILLALPIAACFKEIVAPPPPNASRVVPLRETTPVTSQDDAADDPAIWLNRANPEASLILGTDKQAGVEVYNLAGERVQFIPAGRTNNIDLRMLPDNSQYSAVAAASNRSSNTISLFAIDHDGRVTWLEASEIDTGLQEPYGLCMFQNADGLQVFVNDTDGRFQQWLLSPAITSGQTLEFTARLVRSFRVPSQPEGCVADDSAQRLFLGVENEGIRVTSANYKDATELVSIADIDGTILVADVEGMSLYLSEEGGYLVVSSQGNFSYAIYDSAPPFSYRGSFVIVDNPSTGIDGSQETDGLAASSLLRTQDFPDGLLVVQDGFNELPDEAQNFKYISWQEIALALSL